MAHKAVPPADIFSARAPLNEDPITGAAQSLEKLAAGRKRTLVRTETVNGIPARLEQISGSRPSSSDAAWPTRVWLAQQGNFMVKLEGFGEDGRPATLFEIKRLSLAKPPTFTMNKHGELRLQAAIEGPAGRHGAVTISNVVPFQVTCTSAAPGRQ